MEPPQPRKILEELRPHVIWEVVRWLRGAVILPALYALLHRIQHVPWDWWVLGGLAVVGALVSSSPLLLKGWKLLFPPLLPSGEPANVFTTLFIQGWAEGGILYAEFTNQIEDATLTGMTARLSYHDLNGHCYLVTDGVWRESGETKLLGQGSTATLMLAVTTNAGDTICAPTSLDFGTQLPRLKDGQGFISIRLRFYLYGSQLCTPPPFLFLVKLGKEMRVELVGSIPG